MNGFAARASLSENPVGLSPSAIASKVYGDSSLSSMAAGFVFFEPAH